MFSKFGISDSVGLDFRSTFTRLFEVIAGIFRPSCSLNKFRICFCGLFMLTLDLVPSTRGLAGNDFALEPSFGGVNCCGKQFCMLSTLQ